ncbi:MAG: hypothetical protein R6W06_02565 [Prochlorococcaceae cyanobacterium]
MDASIQRRLSVAVSWAVGRAASLDKQERYEDSYAITQEFREWIMGLEGHPEQLEASVLLLPRSLPRGVSGPTPPADAAID